MMGRPVISRRVFLEDRDADGAVGHYFRKSRHQMPLAFREIATFGGLHLPEPFHISLSSQNQATRRSCRAARRELSSFSSLNREVVRLALAGQKLVCHPLV